MSEYSFHISALDTSVALDCEADRAEREGFKGVRDRQRATALHLRNAVEHMRTILPEGYRIETKIVISHVPDVNPVLRDDIRDRDKFAKLRSDTEIKAKLGPAVPAFGDKD